jgi:hypothetical protein
VGLQQRKPKELGKLSFPICTSRSRFNLFRQTLGSPLPNGVVDLLDRFQPYHSGTSAAAQPLAVLHRLWTSDKHRAPLLVCALPHGAASHLNGAGDHTLDLVLGPFGDGAVIANAVVTGNVDPDLNLTAGFGFQAVFDGGPGIRGLPVLDFLSSLQDETRLKIFPEFARFF